MSTWREQFSLAILAAIRRRDGYVVFVGWEFGGLRWVERVGPFTSAAQLALWLDDLTNEILEVHPPEVLGLPSDVAQWRPVGEQTNRIIQALLEGLPKDRADGQRGGSHGDQW